MLMFCPSRDQPACCCSDLHLPAAALALSVEDLPQAIATPSQQHVPAACLLVCTPAAPLCLNAGAANPPPPYSFVVVSLFVLCF
ncbi:unnamed protein product [Amaranthus hypochondriacus]